MLTIQNYDQRWDWNVPSAYSISFVELGPGPGPGQEPGQQVEPGQLSRT